MTSEVTHRSFRATWTAPDGPVERYRVEYMTLSGRPQQVYLPQTTLKTVSTATISVIQKNVGSVSLCVGVEGMLALMCPNPLFLRLMGNSAQTSISSLLFVLASRCLGV